LQAFGRAISAIIDRHEALRTCVALVDDQPIQLISPRVDFHLPLIDLSGCLLSAALSEARRLAAEETLLAFNLYETPLLRARLIRLAPDDHILLMTFHHIICDGWSIDIFVGELTLLYDAFVRDKPAALPELTIQFADFAHWQRSLLEGERMAELLRFWKQQLEQAPGVLELPTDYPRPAMLSYRGSSISFTIARPVAEAIKALSTSQGASLFMTLMATFNLLLSRYSAQQDILVGTPIANRNRAELEAVIGFFANTLVLRTDLSGNPTFEELLQRVKLRALSAYAHQEMPFEKLVEELKPERNLSHSPLFQVMIVLQNTPMNPMKLSGLRLELMAVEETTAKFELGLSLADNAEAMTGVIEYSTELFEEATIKRMAGHFERLLEEVTEKPDRRISEYEMVTRSEKAQLIVEWNSTRKKYRRSNSLVERVEEQVERQPQAVAVVFRDEELSYEELNRRANQLGHWLKKQGVGAEAIVGVCMKRSAEMVVALLGVMKAGGAYLPLDPEYPRQRIEYMVKQAEPKAIVTVEALRAIVEEDGRALISLDGDKAELESESEANLGARVDAENLAYVIYTSGSTGKPKGVMIPQRGIINRLEWMQAQYQLKESEAVIQKTPYSFDVSVWEFFWPLMVGAKIVMAEPEGHKDARYLVKLIEAEEVNVAHFVPSMLEVFLQEVEEDRCKSVRLVISSGEALEEKTVKRFYERMGGELENLYGPTEASVDVTYWKCERGSRRRRVPIGRPIGNTRMYIVDERMKVVPVGVAGELLIGGEGVGRGYLKRGDLTAEKFIADWLSEAAGERLYRSGDLARYLKDGSIEYVGRIDHQVKVRGYRIELGEVETNLCLHPDVVEATVIACNEGEHSLVAYIVPVKPRTPSTSELRKFLKERLPEYMIPSAFVILEALPLSPNGKLDRRALPAAEALRPTLEAAFIAPNTKVEQLIATAWREVLNLEKVGINDNFFDLGGHSLLLFKVCRKLRDALNKDITIMEMFQHPTISSLAKYLSTDQSEHDNRRNRTSSQSARSQTSDIAIIGMACRFPGANNIEEFWENLRNGTESITFFSDQEMLSVGISAEVINQPDYVKAGAVLNDIELFDAAFFGFNPREAEIMDPQHRLFLEAAWEALENAGYDPVSFQSRTGVFAGVGMNNYLINNVLSNRELMESASVFQTIIGNDKDYLATRVSYKLNLKGPSLTVQTACSTSLVAVHLACKSLLNFESDVALAGGVSISVPQNTGYLFNPGGILSPDGHCRAFDSRAQGMIAGNGLGLVVLKRLDDALADGDCIRAVIKGSAINNDGSLKVGYTAPSVDGQAEVIAEALAAAGVEPATISYIEAHGTATPLGDPVEVAALNQVMATGSWQAGSCAMGSVKTNIGHLDAAAGVAGLIKTVLALEHKQLPASLHYDEANPVINFEEGPLYVNGEFREWDSPGPRRAGVSSFGIGGTNAHVIVEEAPVVSTSPEAEGAQLLILSARTAGALDQATTNLVEHFKQHTEVNLADAAYTLAVGRKRFSHRRVVVCGDKDDAVRLLESLDPKRVRSAVEEQSDRGVVFMFPGQGTQYINMGLELYKRQAYFRSEVDRCCQMLEPHLGLDLREVIYPTAMQAKRAEQQITETYITQPAVFVIEYAMARLLMKWGVRPEAMIGHSIGEYVAACLSGVYSLEDGLRVVAMRGKLMQRTGSGAMLSVAVGEAELKQIIGRSLSVAAVNGPRLCTLSGSEEAIKQVEEELRRKGVASKRVRTSQAFHSEMMAGVEEAFVEEMKKVKLNKPGISYISNVTGRWIKEEETMDARYWGRHLRETVRYWEGIEELEKEEGRVYVEVGPGQALSNMVKGVIKKGGREKVITTMRGTSEEVGGEEKLKQALGELWLSGAAVKWGAVYEGEMRRRVVLPTYPFERQRYWIERRAPGGTNQKGLSKKPDIREWFYTPSWKRATLPRLLKPAEMPDQGTCWLVFSEARNPGPQLIQRLIREGQNVITVIEGTEFTRLADWLFTINPQEKSDYDHLLAELSRLGKTPRMIVHLWTVTTYDPIESGMEWFDRCKDLGFYSLLFLAQALDAQKITCPIKIGIISNRLHEVTGDDLVCPEKVALLEICKRLARDYSNITCRSIDIDLSDADYEQAPTLVNRIISELVLEPPDVIVCYRKGYRWIPTFEQISLTEAFECQARLKQGGVYLITGGMEGIGLTIAKYLAASLQARLILIDSSAIPPQDEWPQWLSQHQDEDAISRKIQNALALEGLGAQVISVSASFADAQNLQAAITQVYQRFGCIDGVIHAAELAVEESSRSIRETSKSDCEYIFQSCAQELLTLESVLQGKDVGFCLLLSSPSWVFTNLRLCAYSAADDYRKAFTHSHNKANPTPWTSIALDVRQGNEKESAEVIQHMLSLDGVAQLMVTPRDLQAGFNQWDDLELSQSTEQLKTAAFSSAHPRPDLQSGFFAPRNELERTIAGFFQTSLGIEQVGIHDDFFELGGHSLLGILVVSNIREAFQIEIPLRRLFESPTVALLSEMIEQAHRAEPRLQAPPMLPVPRDETLMPSFLQRRFWSLAESEPDSARFSAPVALRLKGALNVESLLWAINELINRHEILRTTFAKRDGQLVQRIASASRDGAPFLSLPVVDLSEIPEAEREAELQRRASQDALRPFKLSAHASLLRASLLRLGQQDHVLLLNIHYLLADGWSIAIFCSEMGALYEARCKGEPSPLAELPLQFADFAHWQRQWLRDQALEAELSYWRQRLEGTPALLELPTDRPRPAVQTYRGTREHLRLPKALSESLKALNRQEKVTMFMTLLSAFKVILFQYTDQPDIVVGSVVANRTRANLDRVMGPLTNILALRTDLAGNPSFRELLGRVRQTALDAYAHQEIPFDLLVEQWQLDRNKNHSPLFQAMFNLENDRTPAVKLGGLSLDLLDVDRRKSDFDLALVLSETGEGLAGFAEYNVDLFDAVTIRRMLQCYQTLLETVAADPEQRLFDLPISSRQKANNLTVDSNGISASWS